jgi:hypothetical protein
VGDKRQLRGWMVRAHGQKTAQLIPAALAVVISYELLLQKLLSIITCP